VSAVPAWANRITGSGAEAPDQLLANPRNWRSHPKAQRDALREVLDTVGYVAQVIVNQRTGHLVDGHLRVEEALSHGQPTIPVLYVDLSEQEERLVLASLDPLAAMATTDEAKLRELLAEVSVDSEALAGMLAALAPAEPKDGLTDPDDIPEPPDEAVSKPGDLWLLGEHRLLCGDAGSETDLDRLLDGVTVDLLLTDPPYNVKVEPRSNNAIAAGMAASYDESYQAALAASGSRRRGTKALDAQGLHHSGFDVARGKSGIRHHQKLDVSRHPEKAQATHRKLRAKDRPLVNDFLSDEDFERLLLAWFGNAARVLRPGGSAYIWGGYANIANYPAALKAAGLYFSQAIIWDKEHPVLTRKDFMGAHEVGFYAWKEGAAHRFFGRPNVPDLWHVKKVAPNAMSTSPRSRWSSPGAPSSTARSRVRPSSTPSPARGRRSSPVSRRGDGRTSWRSTRSTAMSSSSAVDGSRVGNRPVCRVAVALHEELGDGRRVVAEGPALDDLAVADVVDLGDAVGEAMVAARGGGIDERHDVLVVAHDVMQLARDLVVDLAHGRCELGLATSRLGPTDLVPDDVIGDVARGRLEVIASHGFGHRPRHGHVGMLGHRDLPPHWPRRPALRPWAAPVESLHPRPVRSFREHRGLERVALDG
jgi:DNA modification methylase